MNFIHSDLKKKVSLGRVGAVIFQCFSNINVRGDTNDSARWQDSFGFSGQRQLEMDKSSWVALNLTILHMT